MRLTEKRKLIAMVCAYVLIAGTLWICSTSCGSFVRNPDTGQMEFSLSGAAKDTRFSASLVRDLEPIWRPVRPDLADQLIATASALDALAEQLDAAATGGDIGPTRAQVAQVLRGLAQRYVEDPSTMAVFDQALRVVESQSLSEATDATLVLLSMLPDRVTDDPQKQATIAASIATVRISLHAAQTYLLEE